MNFAPPHPVSATTLRLERDALAGFLDGAFPASARPDFGELVSAAPGHVRMRLEPTPNMIRPGNIVSGPVLMGMADVAAYALVLAHAGPVGMAVTSGLNISFLRPCKLASISADARLLKLGRRAVVVDVRLWQGEENRPVAQAIVNYALPVAAGF